MESKIYTEAVIEKIGKLIPKYYFRIELIDKTKSLDQGRHKCKYDEEFNSKEGFQRLCQRVREEADEFSNIHIYNFSEEEKFRLKGCFEKGSILSNDKLAKYENKKQPQIIRVVDEKKYDFNTHLTEIGLAM